MRFPFVLIPQLEERHLERYRRHVDSDASGWHRRFTESIWRRHQHPSNAHLSGWRDENDCRRRLLHFYDEYGVEGRSFVLRHAYLRLNLTLPAEHIEEYQAVITEGLRVGGWRRDGDRWQRGDLWAALALVDVHEQDRRHGRFLPANYRNLDVVVASAGCRLPDGWQDRPWDVFYRVGLRRTLPRGRPRMIAPEEIAEDLPAQVELGCGPSIEAGIPHLSTLHRIYGVSAGDYRFVFRAQDDGLLTLFADPEAKYREMTDIYRACLVAESTPFYDRLRELHERGHLVGPVITNNFDSQCAVLGLPEISLRRYDWGPYYPHIEHHPRARSLLVIGVHADRRLVQMRARQRGLRVIFIDPESYVAPDGRLIPYPVEAPQDADLFARVTAHDGFAALHRAVVR